MGVVLHMPVEYVTYRACPHCRYEVMQKQLQEARDMVCPFCKAHKLSDFQAVSITKHINPRG